MGGTVPGIKENWLEGTYFEMLQIFSYSDYSGFSFSTGLTVSPI